MDLDGTLAEYGDWQGPNNIGKPIPKMVERVKEWLAKGVDVRIFTARVALPVAGTHRVIEDWCVEHIGVALPITCSKDYAMMELWDDRCVQVIPSTGERADGQG